MVPDPNEPLESTLRHVKNIVVCNELVTLQPNTMKLIRAELINFKNLEVQAALTPKDHGEA